MPLGNLLKSAAGTCSFCNQKAGMLSRKHSQCRGTFQAGWNEMVRLAFNAAAYLPPQHDDSESANQRSPMRFTS